MPITVITGRAGSGKTAYLCQQLIKVLNRNVRYHKKTGKIRKVWVNFPLAPHVEKRYTFFLEHWETVEQLIKVEEADIFIDELLYYFDATLWKETTQAVKKFLAIHRHLGIEIYSTSQDFAQVDIAFRRLTDSIYYLVKLASSREPSATKPPVKFIWGISAKYTINPTDYKENAKENSTTLEYLDPLFFITREKCEIYDTKQKFKPSPPVPLRHIEQECEDPNCKVLKIKHI